MFDSVAICVHNATEMLTSNQRKVPVIVSGFAFTPEMLDL